MGIAREMPRDSPDQLRQPSVPAADSHTIRCARAAGAWPNVPAIEERIRQMLADTTPTTGTSN